MTSVLRCRRPPGRPKKREEGPDAAVAGADGAGGDGLPAMYRRVRAKPQAWGGRFEDAGTDALNATRFAGLEGEIANGYANSLLQVKFSHGDHAHAGQPRDAAGELTACRVNTGPPHARQPGDA